MSDLAEKYSKTSSHQYSLGKAFLQKIDLQSGQTVLDIGCGTGELAAIIAKRVGEKGKVLAIDPDKDRVAFAREKFKGVSNLTFLEAGISEVPRDSYDVIFSSNVFHWISKTELQTALTKLFGYLKPGGVVGIQAMNDSPTTKQIIACFPEKSQEEILSTFRLKSGEEYEEILKTAGYQNIRWEIIETNNPFRSKEEVFNFHYNFSIGLIDVQQACQEKLDTIEWKITSSRQVLFECSVVVLLASK